MVRETSLEAADFIYPLFVTHGRQVRHPIRSMPGIAQLSVDEAVQEAERAAGLGVPAVILFGIRPAKARLAWKILIQTGLCSRRHGRLKRPCLICWW
jgi:porphobilinogen synthase